MLKGSSFGAQYTHVQDIFQLSHRWRNVPSHLRRCFSLLHFPRSESLLTSTRFRLDPLESCCWQNEDWSVRCAVVNRLTWRHRKRFAWQTVSYRSRSRYFTPLLFTPGFNATKSNVYLVDF